MIEQKYLSYNLEKEHSMKKYFNLVMILFLLFLTFQILTLSTNVIESIRFSFSIWKNNIFPSLFPFFVLSSLLIHYGFIEFLSELLKPFMRIFKISSRTSFILFMSMISGFPSSAKYTRELYKENLLTKEEAEKILTFSHFSNPLFILGTIGLFLNQKIALLILFIHYGTNFIVGIIFRNFYPSEEEQNYFSLKNAITIIQKKKRESFGNILTKAILDSINTLLLILGTMSIFLIITTIIDYHLDIPAYFQCIIDGFLEMTQGIKYTADLSIAIKIKAVLMTMYLSFGGISVHMQTISILSDTDIRYFPYFVARLLHAGLSSFLVYLCFDIFI